MASLQKLVYMCVCLVFLLLCRVLFNRLSVSVVKLQRSYPLRVHSDEVPVRRCWGHYYLCSLRRMLSDHKTYANVSFPLNSDIYDFSSVTRFSTNFFRNRPTRPGNGLKMMAALRQHMLTEHKEEILAKNIHISKHHSKDLKPICHFTPSGYFAYHLVSLRLDGTEPVSISIKMIERLVDPHRKSEHLMFPDIHTVVRTQRTKAECPTKDYFRGIYHIQCPVFQDVFTVSVFGSYRAPSSEQYTCNNDDLWLIKNFTDRDLLKFGLQLPPNLKSAPSSFTSTSSVESALLSLPRCASTDLTRGEFWLLRSNGVWHWASQRCYFDFHFDNVLMECLRRKDIHMYGDSHMAYRHQSLLDYTGSTGSTFRFTRSIVASELAEQLARLARNKTAHQHRHAYRRGPQPVLVLNSGHWNFRHLDVASYASAMLDVARVIGVLQRADPELMVIWMQSGAITYNRYCFRWKLNSFIAAMNDWVDKLMRGLSVTVVPAFDISFPVNAQTRDGMHYLELLGENATKHSNKFSVGGAITTVLLHTICGAK